MHTAFKLQKIAFIVAFCLAALLGADDVVSGAERLIDDFSGSTDSGWFRNADGLAGGIESGNWTVEEGVYHLSSTRAVDPQEPGQIASNWGLDEPDPLGEGTLRLKLSAQTQGTVAGLIMGNIPLDEEGAYEDYFFVVGSTHSRSFFGFRCENDSSCAFMGEFSAPFRPGDPWWLEATVAGGEVSLTAWREGSQKPELPQLVYADSNPFTPQRFGVGGWIADGFNSPEVIDMTFDDIYFTPVPEPSTSGLFGIGCALFAANGRRRRLSVSSRK